MIYPFRVYLKSDSCDPYWVAQSSCLKGCVGQGKTANKAIKELEANETEWISAAEIAGIDIPEVPITNAAQYSGKFTVRISPIEHCIAAENAKKENISLNQYVNDAIVSKNAAYLNMT